MRNQNNPKFVLSNLRQKAEELLKNKVARSPLQILEFDDLKLLHKLEVHQIELELQNEELLLSQSEMKEATEKYAELYDSVPTGFFTLSTIGEITELNLSGAAMLGKPRHHLKNSNLGVFITSDTRAVYARFLDNIFLSHTKETCEVTIMGEGLKPMPVHISGIFDKNMEQCRLSVVDLTESKLAEKALIDKEQKYRFMLESSEIGMGVYSLEGKILYYNQRALHNLGGKADDYVGKTLHEIFGKAAASVFIARIQESAQSDKSIEYEEFVSLNPGDRWFLSIYSRLTNPDGNVFGIQVIAHDITERKQTEEKLRASTEFTNSLFTSMTEGVAILDTNGVHIDANQALCRMTGFSREELFGNSTPFRYWPKEEYNHIYAAFQKTMAGETGNFELTFMRKNGERFPAIVSPFAIKDKLGNIISYSATIKDISERKLIEEELKQSKAQLELAHQLAGAGTWGWDMVNNELTWSKELFVLFGLVPAKDKATFDTWTEVVHPDDRAHASERIEQAIRDKTLLNSEYRILHSDGKIHWICALGNTIYNHAGQPLQMSGICTDITERKQIQEALKLNETRLMRAELVSKSGNWELHLDSGIMIGSEGASKIYGVEKDKFEYAVIKGIPLPEYRPMLDNALKLLIEEDKPYDVEFKITTADTGTIKDLHSLAIYNEKEKILLGVIQDITDRKQAENALIASEEKFKNLVRDMQVGVLLQGPQAEILLCNPKALELLGLTEDQLLGKTSFDPDWNVIHEDGSHFPGNTHPVPQAINTRLPVRDVIMGVYHPLNRERIWLKVDAELQLNEDGTVQHVVCTFIDISIRKQAENALLKSEEQFRWLFENSIDSVSVHQIVQDEQGNPVDYIFLRTNAAFEKQTGLHGEDILGKRVTEVLPGTEKTPLIGIYGKVALSGEPVTFEQYFEPLGKHYHINAYQVGYGLFVTVFQDITERKRIEEEIKRKNEELQKLNIEKDKFFSIIAHDLRSPFNAFLGLTQMMEEELPTITPEELQKIATTLRKSANMLFLLLENLLEWSKMQRGLSSFKPEEFLLKARISRSIVPIRDAIEKKKILLKFNIPADVAVTADILMFESLIRNLVFNAVKFTPVSGEITISAVKKNSEEVEISISDTGIGMDKGILNKLFRLNEKINRAGTEGEPSTGLGLFICKDFVEKHGGRIWAESEAGKGSTFYFTIPFIEQVQKGSVIIGFDPATQPAAAEKKLKIAIADDDEVSIMLLKLAVKKMCSNILLANTGKEIVNICAANPDTDLILMDVKMPVMDGYEAAATIRKLNKKVVIIAQTAFGKINERDSAIAAGCNDYIVKPINPVLLVELIHKYF